MNSHFISKTMAPIILTVYFISTFHHAAPPPPLFMVRNICLFPNVGHGSDAIMCELKWNETGIWSPGSTPQPIRREFPGPSENPSARHQSEPSLAQQSPTPDRKEFRSVKFESPTVQRKVFVSWKIEWCNYFVMGRTDPEREWSLMRYFFWLYIFTIDTAFRERTKSVAAID